MRRFLRSMALVLVGAISGLLGATYYFDLPININPIAIFNFGTGKVEVDNEVNQGRQQPAPSPSPAQPAKPSPSPETAESKPTPTPPVVPEERSVERAPEVASNQPEPSDQPESVARNYRQRQHARSSFVSIPPPPPPRRRSCDLNPIMVVEPPDEEDFQDSEPYVTAPAQRVWATRRVTRRVRVTVNGRVVSDRVYTETDPDNDD
jgi:hypothetical protein